MSTLTALFFPNSLSPQSAEKLEPLLQQLVADIVVTELSEEQVEQFEQFLATQDVSGALDYVREHSPSTITAISEEIQSLRAHFARFDSI